MKRANGTDDPVLIETSWPLPSTDTEGPDVEHRLRYGDPASVRFEAAEIVAAYRALIADGTTTQQLKRLAALRRVHRRRMR